MKRIFGVMFVCFLVFALAGCGGSSDSSGSGVVTDVESLSDIPDDLLNPEEYDVTTSSTISGNVAVSSIASKQNGEQGGFSRAGCETNRMKKNIIRSAIQPRMILCHMEAFEAALGEEAAGSGEFKYWRGDSKVPENVEGPPGVDEFVPRMAIKRDGKMLTFVMCNRYTKALEFVIDTSEGVYAGHVINRWGDSHADQMDFNADGPPDNFTVANFTQSFVEDSEFWSGFGSETLEATPSHSTVYGFYNESGNHSFAGAIYAMFDREQGTARFRADSGSYPAPTVQEAYDMCVAHEGAAVCGGSVDGWLDNWLNSAEGCGLAVTAEDRLCFQPDGCPTTSNAEGQCEITAGEGGTESFSIDATDPLHLVFRLAESSDYAEQVAAATLPDSSSEPSIEFTLASADVDCAASDSWTDMAEAASASSSPPNLQPCMAMEQELNNWEVGDLCNQQEGSAKGGGGQQQ